MHLSTSVQLQNYQASIAVIGQSAAEMAGDSSDKAAQQWQAAQRDWRK